MLSNDLQALRCHSENSKSSRACSSIPLLQPQLEPFYIQNHNCAKCPKHHRDNAGSHCVFTASPKHNAVLKLQLGKQLTKLCDTRWVERHNAVLQFRESLGSIAKALETVSQWREPSSAAKARSLLTSILDAEFVIATLALYDLLSVTLPLSRLLQKPDLEMNSASDIVKDTIVVLSEKRNPLNVEKTFRDIFAHAEEIAENMGAQLDVPRLVQRQMN
ncbi:unnamed protein product [Ixodes pacificus]